MIHVVFSAGYIHGNADEETILGGEHCVRRRDFERHILQA